MRKSTKTWRALLDLTGQLIAAKEDDKVESIHRQMHELDPKGRYFQCDSSCPLGWRSGS